MMGESDACMVVNRISSNSVACCQVSGQTEKPDTLNTANEGSPEMIQVCNSSIIHVLSVAVTCSYHFLGNIARSSQQFITLV